jgi:methionyl-tRNA formyltransferase
MNSLFHNLRLYVHKYFQVHKLELNNLVIALVNHSFRTLLMPLRACLYPFGSVCIIVAVTNEFYICSDKTSWVVDFWPQLDFQMKEVGFDVSFIYSHIEVPKNMTCILLGYSQLVKPSFLDNSNFLVIHESDLPKGRGWSPLSWQILEGKSEISVCLFQANPNIDAGEIFLKSSLKLVGYELIKEIREKLINIYVIMLKEFFANRDSGTLHSMPQIGTPSFYPRRFPLHSQINLSLPLIEQFNLLRIVDNERYPAFFEHLGHRYLLRIELEGESGS